jgi:GntR family transcriptional regulator
MTSSDTRHRWAVIYDDLRRRIDNRDLAPGQQIPGELDLAEQYSVSRQTVRTALSRLQHEGLISAGRGRLGRVVRDNRPLWWDLTRFERSDRRDDPTTGLDDWAAGVVEQGRTPRQEVTVGIVAPPSDISIHLQLDDGDLTVKRQRIRYVDNVPYQLATSWFPEHLARGTVLMEPHDIAMPGGLMAHIGRPQSRVHDEIVVRMPTPTEREALDLSTGTPVGQHLRIGYDENNCPLRVMVTIFPGDRHFLVYDQDL